MSRRGGLVAVCLLAVATGALWVRLARLDQRVMHGDEANQAVKAGILWETGRYDYDPEEHHGPSLYWLTLPSLWLSGAGNFAQTTEFNYRVVPTIFGAGLVLLLALVADGLGRPAAVLAGLLTAISPAMVYYSRYYIQETLLVFFTFAAIACAWRYLRSGSVAWAAAAGASLGLMHATKETWVLAGAAMALALAATIAWARWRSGAWPGLRKHLRPAPVLVAFAAACLAAVALYSSFGRHWQGPLDSILAYTTYVRRGSEAGIHTHPWSWYLELLAWFHPSRGFLWTEGTILVLAAVGAIGCTLGRLCFCTTSPAAGERPNEPMADEGVVPGHGLPVFLAFYTVALTSIYAAVPYKTPWCMLSFLHGMILLAGVGGWAILARLPGWPLKALAALVLAAGVVHLGWETWWLNFRIPADSRNPYVYAHTSSDVLNLPAQMERLAAVSPEGHSMAIHVVTPENYWPLPWYLRRFDRVGYWSDPAAWTSDTRGTPPPPVVLVTQDVQAEIEPGLRAAYHAHTVGLRPKVFLSVHVREDLWEAFSRAAQRQTTDNGPRTTAPP